MESGNNVIDETGKTYVLDRSLGRGGQGEVWLARGGKRVVKLIAACRNRDALRRQIGFVKRLDLDGLFVARPLSLLRAPDVGYVAEFLDDMVPVRALMKPPRGEPIAAWYQRSGGLRRRLRLLAHAGEALLGLHGKGLIYVDVSHANVFVSEPVDATEAWLIDLDNLRHESDPESVIHTPGYGAPEVVSGRRGASSWSDAWGFAVLVVQALGLVHPFLGDLVEDGEPELQDEAFAGRLPWIEHADDPRNRSSQGIPRERVLGKRLLELARKTFEPGIAEPTARARVSLWVERLHAAADQTVRCEECEGTFFVTEPSCPWCPAAKPPVLAIRFHRWEPGNGIVKGVAGLPQLPYTGETVLLPRRLTHAEGGQHARSPVASIGRSPRGAELRPLGNPLWLSPPGSLDDIREVRAEGARLELRSLDESPVIHFGPPDRAHRVAQIGGGR